MTLKTRTAKLFFKVKYKIKDSKVAIDFKFLGYNMVSFKIRKQEFLAFMKPFVEIYDILSNDKEF